MLSRALGIRGAVFEPQFTGPDRTMFTEELMTLRPMWHFSGFAEPFGGTRSFYSGKSFD